MLMLRHISWKLMKWFTMSSERKVRYQRNTMGYWILQHPSGLYPADTAQGFWSNHQVEAMRFLTKEEANACAEYLSTSVISGIKCDSLLVEPLFQM
jgi:hypothetical protein